MSRLSHAFSVEYAEKYGVECAILISHFQFWIEQNQVVGRNFHDDRTWMYQSQKEISACYPYWSEDTVYRTIKKLVDCEVLIKGNYNKSKFDQTSWYAFKNEKIFTKPRNRGNDTTTPQNPDLKPAEPIPDTNPVAYPKKQQQQPASAAAPLSKSFQENGSPKISPKLHGVNIPPEQKFEIAGAYDEKTIDDAIDWALDPKNPPKKCLAASIKFACKNKLTKPLPPEDKSEYHKAYAKKYDGKRSNGATVTALSKSVEIDTGCSYTFVSLMYDCKGFMEQFTSALRKANFPIAAVANG